MADQPPVTIRKWAVHHPGGAVQTDGILGQEHAYVVARSVDGAVLGPYAEAEVQRLAELAARPYRRDPQAFTEAERDDFWALLDRRALPDA